MLATLPNLTKALFKENVLLALRLGRVRGTFSTLVCNGVGVRKSCGLRTVGIGCAHVRVGNNIRSVGHKFVYELKLPAFLGSIWTQLHIHRLVLFVVVVYGRPLLHAWFPIFHKIWTKGKDLGVQVGPIVYTCTLYVSMWKKLNMLDIMWKLAWHI